MPATLPVESVADTALLTAFCRALESERPDAVFRDPYARRLAGPRGEQLLRRFSGGTLTAAGCAVRTSILDSLIVKTLREDAVDTVVNLGAGLDTRPYRLALSPSIAWMEVDHPAVLAYKAKILEPYFPACALESVPLDIADVGARQSFLARVGASASRVLVVTEGLLVYMTPDAVAALASDLHKWPPFQWWLTDLVSSRALTLMQSRYCESPNSGNVSLRFAPAAGPEFFQPYGWETAEFHSCLQEGQRLNRLFLADALLAADFSDEQRQVLLELFTVAKLKTSGPNGVGCQQVFREPVEGRDWFRMARDATCP
jgi:methyltransferase (TIGR00027 family)